MRKIIVTVLILLVTTPAFAAKKKHPYRPVTEKEKTLYAVGLVLARQLEVFDLTPSELWVVKRGFTDATRGKKTKVNFATYSKKSQELATARRDAHGKKLAPLVPKFMARESAREGAVKTPSGLIYQPGKEGEGVFPAASDKVKVHYRTTLIDGKEVESTYKAGQPDEAVVSEYMKCLVEGLQMMKPGGTARLICPPELALGKEGSGVIPPDSTLVFDVELLQVSRDKGAPGTPNPQAPDNK